MKLPNMISKPSLVIFQQSLTSKFVEKSPNKYALVRNGKSLNPEIMCSKSERGKKCFQSLVDNLILLERVTPKMVILITQSVRFMLNSFS